MEVTSQPHAHAALPPGEGLSVLPVERDCVDSREKNFCQGRNYNFGPSNPYSSQYADHDIQGSLYNAFGSKVCSRRGAITLKSSDLKEHVSVICTFEFSTGPVREHIGIPQLFLSLKNSPSRHHFI